MNAVREFRRALAFFLHVVILPASFTLSLNAAEPASFSDASATHRTSAFVRITNLHQFKRAPGTNRSETVFTSPEIPTPIAFDELILSWNVKTATNYGFRFEVRPVWTNSVSHFYQLGVWTAFPGRHARQSISGQKDALGSVSTDTLLLKQPCRGVEIRIGVLSEEPVKDLPIEFLAFSILNRGEFAGLNTNQASPAEKLLPVPERSQLSYEGGRDWCSPTSVSMVLAYWAAQLRHPEIDRDVPLVAAGVHDPEWPGTGNWPFNTAFAGMTQELQAYVRHLSGLADLQALIEEGIPPVVSVSFDYLNGRTKDEGSGHLIVCVGTTASGDFVINDPWAHLDKGERVRRVVSRERLLRAWSRSRGVVYLIKPQ